MQRKIETDWAQKIYKKRSKTAELPFAHIKQNMKLHEFTTTGIKNTNTEFKLYAIGHNQGAAEHITRENLQGAFDNRKLQQ